MHSAMNESEIILVRINSNRIPPGNSPKSHGRRDSHTSRGRCRPACVPLDGRVLTSADLVAVMPPAYVETAPPPVPFAMPPAYIEPAVPPAATAPQTLVPDIFDPDGPEPLLPGIPNPPALTPQLPTGPDYTFPPRDPMPIAQPAPTLTPTVLFPAPPLPITLPPSNQPWPDPTQTLPGPPDPDPVPIPLAPFTGPPLSQWAPGWPTDQPVDPKAPPLPDPVIIGPIIGFDPVDYFFYFYPWQQEKP